EVTAPDSIRIMVYEKALAGCVETLGNYIYFDRDGIVVEISDKKTDGIPLVIGLQIGSFALNQPLPVDDESIFGDILMVTQLLASYEIRASKLYFDRSRNLTLYFDDARVQLGADKQMEEKLMLLKNILPSLEGKKGVLRLENYDENTKSVTFELE
ncbi:MAG: cell division protein FtsQ/DivIB, partial [Lachnospiraceae bacterium]|nr:cell division protein FtsQ/DivIB [Lachnospiraceae bacterium]